jgi:polar amino acid transport system permease protein
MLWQDIKDFTPILLDGATITIVITMGCLAISTVLGMVLALIKMSSIPLLPRIVGVLINIVRGLPMIVLLFYIYFVLPDIGIQLTSLQASVLGLGFAYATYVAEVFRSGIESVDIGQFEAAKSLGMSQYKTMTRVILPQAFKVALPPYSNMLVMMLKDTSLASTIAVAEMTRAGMLLANSTFKNITIYSIIAIMYLLMSAPLMYLSSWLERHFGKHAAR